MSLTRAQEIKALKWLSARSSCVWEKYIDLAVLLAEHVGATPNEIEAWDDVYDARNDRDDSGMLIFMADQHDWAVDPEFIQAQLDRLRRGVLDLVQERAVLEFLLTAPDREFPLSYEHLSIELEAATEIDRILLATWIWNRSFDREEGKDLRLLCRSDSARDTLEVNPEGVRARLAKLDEEQGKS